MTRKSLVAPFHLLIYGLLIAITITAWVKIPDGAGLPVHWGLDGHPDRTWPKLQALIGAPSLAALVVITTYLFGRLAPEEQVEPGRHISEAALSGVLGLFCAVQFGMLLIGIGSDIDMIRIVAGAVAVILLVLGNALPKSQPNGYSGLRLPWTLSDPRNWTRTHRLTGIVMMIAAVGLGAVVWLAPDPGILLASVLAAVFGPLILAVIFSVVVSMSGDRHVEH